MFRKNFSGRVKKRQAEALLRQEHRDQKPDTQQLRQLEEAFPKGARREKARLRKKLGIKEVF